MDGYEEDTVTAGKLGDGHLEEPVEEVQAGPEGSGTIVVFDLEVARALAEALPGWRIISSPSPAAALTDQGALVTSWLPLMTGPGPWVLVPPFSPDSDRPTYDMLKAWEEEAEAAQLEDIRCCVLPGKEDQVGWVRSRSADHVERMIQGAGPLKLRKVPPAAQRQVRRKITPAGAPIIDVNEATIRMPDYVDELGQVHPGPVLMSGGCPVVTAVETVSIDLVPGQPVLNRFILAIALPDGRRIPITTPVAVPKLQQIDHWLSAASAPIACSPWIDPSPGTGAKIAAAIKVASAEAPKVQVLTRSGWIEIDGRPYYLTTTGGIGADGLSPVCRAEIDYQLDFSPGLDLDPVEAWRKAISISERLVDPTPYFAILAFGAAVLAGLPPKGSLILLGDGSAGKTSVLRAALAPYGGLMATWAGTMLSKGELLAGCHQAPGLVDDLPPKASRVEQEKQVEALDLLLRRGYDKDVGYGRLQPSETSVSGVRRLPGDKTAPGICVSMELVPDKLADTGRERALIWHLTKEKTWHKSKWDETRADWVGSPLALAAGASLLRVVALHIERAGGLKAWYTGLEKDGIDFGETAKRILSSCPPRLKERLRTYFVGAVVLRMVWDSVGVPEEESDEWGELLDEALVNWSSGVKETGKTESASVRFFEAVQAAVGSGRAVICNDDEVVPAGAERIGRHLSDGSVALLPQVVSKVTGYPQDMTRQLLGQLCGPAKNVYIGGMSPRAYIVPADKWWSEGRRPEPSKVDF